VSEEKSWEQQIDEKVDLELHKAKQQKVPWVSLYLQFAPKVNEKVIGTFAHMFFDFNVKFNLRAIQYASGMYKKAVIARTPDPELERKIRFGPFSYKDDTRYSQKRNRGEYPLREAIAMEPIQIDHLATSEGAKQYIARAKFGNVKRINKRTNFRWVHKKRVPGRPGMSAGYEWRAMDPNKIDTLEKFEYGGTWDIVPRDPKGALHPWRGDQITFTPSWREKTAKMSPEKRYGYKHILKQVYPRRMFTEAVNDAKRQITSALTMHLKTYLSNGLLTIPIVPIEKKETTYSSEPVLTVGSIGKLPRKHAVRTTRRVRKAYKRKR